MNPPTTSNLPAPPLGAALEAAADAPDAADAPEAAAIEPDMDIALVAAAAEPDMDIDIIEVIDIDIIDPLAPEPVAASMAERLTEPVAEATVAVTDPPVTV